MDLLTIRPRARTLALAAATLAVTAAPILAAAPARAAPSFAITVAPDPVAGIPTQVGVAGTGGEAGLVAAVTRKPAGGTCAATSKADDGTLVGGTTLHDGPFAWPWNATFDRPGDYLVCAWIERIGILRPTAVLAARGRIVTVRAPRLSLAVAATPTTVTSGQSVRVTATTQTEVERGLYVYGVLDVGRGCPANAEAASETDGAFWIAEDRQVLGGPSSTTADVTLERLGTRLICAYLQREYLWDPAEVVAQTAVTVTAPPAPCVVPSVAAGEAPAAASARIRGAGCSVGVVRYEPSARFARGTVVRVAPVAGTSLAAGAAVDLWVSAGAPCVVPALPASRTVADVRRRLVAAGCAAGRVTRRHSAAVRKGRVVALGRPRGTRLAPRTRIALVVSRGPWPRPRP